MMFVNGINYQTILSVETRSQSHPVVGPSGSECQILPNEDCEEERGDGHCETYRLETPEANNGSVYSSTNQVEMSKWVCGLTKKKKKKLMISRKGR